MAHGRDLEKEYFCTYSNNIIPMFFLSKVILFSNLIKIGNPYYIIAMTGILISVLAVCSAMFLLWEGNGKFRRMRLLLGLFIAFVPIWVISQTLYTDQMSYCVAVCSIALFKASGICKKRHMSILCCVIAELLFAVGVFIKITVLIPIIAAVIVLFFQRITDGKL